MLSERVHRWEADLSPDQPTVRRGAAAVSYKHVLTAINGHAVGQTLIPRYAAPLAERFTCAYEIRDQRKFTLANLRRCRNYYYHKIKRGRAGGVR